MNQIWFGLIWIKTRDQIRKQKQNKKTQQKTMFSKNRNLTKFKQLAHFFEMF